MGNPAVPPYAQLALFFMELPSLSNFAPNISFYARYFDDIFTFFQGTETEASAFIADLNSQQERVKFTGTITPATTPTPFLDLLIWIDNDGCVCYKPYTKPVSRFLYIPFKSDHPKSTLQGFIIGECKRLAINSSLPLYWQEATLFFMQNLIHRGYPADFILDAISTVIFADRTSTLNKYHVRSMTSVYDPFNLYFMRLPTKPTDSGNQLNVYGNHQARTYVLPLLQPLITKLSNTWPPLFTLNEPIRYVSVNNKNIQKLVVRAAHSGNPVPPTTNPT